jgi:hypothetical protein
MNAVSSLNSSALISNGRPPRRNSPRVKSTSISPKANNRFGSQAGLARRRRARMRARSSCGLKGLVTSGSDGRLVGSEPLNDMSVVASPEARSREHAIESIEMSLPFSAKFKATATW